MLDFIVRPYRTADQAGVEELEQRVQPYRPEDAAAVEAMHERARRARDQGAGWTAHVPEPDSTDDIPRWYAGFWVATAGSDVIGIVGVRRSFLPGVAPPRDSWHARSDVAELRRLRVAPEAWRSGVATALTRAVIDWCREDGCRVLYLHTTSAQAPARAFYRATGFRDVGHIPTGEYVYVWYAMDL